MVLAVADGTEETTTRVREAIPHPVQLRLAAQSDLMRAIDTAYRALIGVESQVKVFEARDTIRRDVVRNEPEVGSDDAPVVQVVQKILTQALRDRASDVHIEPQDERVRVRYRIDGALHDVLELPGSMAPALVSRVKIMAGMNIVERRRPQDGQITTQIEDRPGRHPRLHRRRRRRREGRHADAGQEPTAVRPGAAGHARRDGRAVQGPDPLAVRHGHLRGPDRERQDHDALRLAGRDQQPGPQHHDHRGPGRVHLPVDQPDPDQRAAGLTFASGLRSILRQDPDVILVGEIRDADTARIAVQSALTGHFVLSSVHATDTVSALHRLIDMGIETFLVASSVTTVISQRLVRRVCGYCRESYAPSPEERAFLDSISPGHFDDVFYRGAGCNFCAHTGYLERVGVYEMMPVTERIRELVLDRAAHDELRKVARSEGMQTLLEEAARLVRNGTTTVAEVMRSVYVTGV